MDTFTYGDAEINYLKSRDELLGKAIDKIGIIKREVTHDVFKALINNIISQHISGKSATTVWNRLQDRVTEVTAKNIFDTPVEDIQKCGMSMRKATYIKGVSNSIINEEINIENLKNLPDQEVIKILSSLNGVGVWTAEMILIFSMARPDVLSYGDLAIRRGIMNLYNLEDLSKEDFKKYKQMYSPYASIASLYLWELS